MSSIFDTNQLTNIEFTLLQLLAERREASGYEIDKLVKQRGYREWAGIGMTSIYTGLDKLNKRGLIEFYVPAEKQGKGPLPKIFRLTDSGRAALRHAVLESLASVSHGDRRFNLALAAMPAVSTREAIIALRKRKTSLLGDHERIDNKFKADGGEFLPVHVKAVFKHPLLHIETEIAFIDELIASLEQEVPYTGQGRMKPDQMSD